MKNRKCLQNLRVYFDSLDFLEIQSWIYQQAVQDAAQGRQRPRNDKFQKKYIFQNDTWGRGNKVAYTHENNKSKQCTTALSNKKSISLVSLRLNRVTLFVPIFNRRLERSYCSFDFKSLRDLSQSQISVKIITIWYYFSSKYHKYHNNTCSTHCTPLEVLK